MPPKGIRVRREVHRPDRPMTELAFDPRHLARIEESQGSLAAMQGQEPDTEASGPGFPAIDPNDLLALPALDRLIVLGHYWGNIPLTPLGRLMGLDRFKASRTLDRALKSLRARLSSRVAAAPSAEASSGGR